MFYGYAQTHYYQPLWTLVGAGIKNLSDSGREMTEVMPAKVDWIPKRCAKIDPMKCELYLEDDLGSIKYDYLVVAVGIELDWNKVDGLTEALKIDNSGVCSNYSSETVLKTWHTLKQFTGGHALFTFPNTPIKCAGAPQKIMYLTDSYLRKVIKLLIKISLCFN